MKYLLILGRNIELSKAEALSYFEKEGNPILGYSIVKNGMLIDVNYEIKIGEIQNLGGVISIGEVISSGRGGELEKNLEKKMIYSGKENKLNYCLWDFSKNHSKIQEYLKGRFKEEKLKATEKHLRGKIDMQGGEKMNVPSSKLLDFEYFLFEEDEINYFGKMIEFCDYEKIEKRDMEKPVRREELAIAPRLAKILINLSQVKKGETLFDPFCGIGVILQEALLQEIKVFGSDIDSKAIKGANQNLKWFGFDNKNYEVIHFDSRKVEISKVEGIATEPDLGEILKKIPTKEKAEKTLRKFENLMIEIINNSKEKISGRVVFTSPLIRTGKKRLSCNIEKICKETGYIEVISGIEEYRGNQIVGRKIFVIKKQDNNF